MTISPEQIEKNWNKFLSMCKYVGVDRIDAVDNMCETLGERFALAPASGRLEHHCAWPGGLVQHSLNVLLNASAIAKACNVVVPKESLVLCSLMHDIGKIGYENPTEDYYLPQDSDWHKDKLGETYKANKSIMKMTVPHRSLYLLQHFGIKLTREEFVAIMIHDGQHCEENKPYSMHEPNLAAVITMADYISTKQEKELFDSGS